MLKKRLFSFLIFSFIAALVVASGYLFAKKKAEPVYQSKIDKLIFDQRNKAPNFVLVLPDYKTKEEVEVSAPENLTENEEEKKHSFVVSEIKNQIPLAARVEKNNSGMKMRIIHPMSELQERKGDFLIPKISPEGKKAWLEYSRPVKVMPNFYRVSIVLSGLGLDDILTNSAIENLPENVSLSFSPYAENLKEKITKARQAGHETYVDLLLASKDFMKSDTGPLAMSITTGMNENILRLQKALNIEAAYGGIVVQNGLFDTENHERITFLLNALRDMGLLMVDMTGEGELQKVQTQKLPRKKADIVISDFQSKPQIMEKLKEAENIAKEKGMVLVAFEPKPVALHAINEWVKSFSPQIEDYEKFKETKIDRPFILVPVSNEVVE